MTTLTVVIAKKVKYLCHLRSNYHNFSVNHSLVFIFKWHFEFWYFQKQLLGEPQDNHLVSYFFVSLKKRCIIFCNAKICFKNWRYNSFLNMIQMKCVRKYVYVYNVHNSTVVCRGGGLFTGVVYGISIKLNFRNMAGVTMLKKGIVIIYKTCL